MPKPSVGRVVHYVSHGTPRREDGTQAFASECRAAIVTQVHDDRSIPANGIPDVGLVVLNPSGMFFHEEVRCDQTNGPEGGTWHWPERVEG